MDNRSHRDNRAARTDRQEASSESTSYDWAHREASRQYLRSPSLAPTLTSPLHLDRQPKNWLERIPKVMASKKRMVSGKSVPENTKLSFAGISVIQKDKTKKSATPTVLLSIESTSSSAVPVSQAPPEVDGSGSFTDKQPLNIAWRSLFPSPQMEAIISDVVEYFGEPRLLSTSRPLQSSSRKSQLSSPPAPVSSSNPSRLPAIIPKKKLSSLQSMSLEAVQTKKRSLSATQSGETKNERQINARKIGQASVHELKRQEGDLVNTAVAAPPESNPTTRTVETLQNVIDLAASEHEAWKIDYRTTDRPTKQSDIASGPKETLLSSEPSTKPGPPLPTNTKRPPITNQEKQRLAALATEDDGKPPIKPEPRSEHPARPSPLPNTNPVLCTRTISPIARSTNPTTSTLTSKISYMRTALTASKSQHLTDVTIIKQLKAEKITIRQDGRRELQLLKEEKNAEIVSLGEEVKDLNGENRAVEKRCSMLRDPVFGGLLGEFVRLGRGAVEGKGRDVEGEEGNEKRGRTAEERKGGRDGEEKVQGSAGVLVRAR